jgi:uncharacterized protein
VTGRAAGRVDLAGARVLLTGASSGIGRALAFRLAQQGAELVVAGRRPELLAALCDEIATAGHCRPRAVPVDVGVPGAATALAGTALGYFGCEIDIVINNAGCGLGGSQSRIGDQVVPRTVHEVNLWMPLALSAALIPTMLTLGSGTIVNVTPAIQSVPLPLAGSAKSALAQATRALRLALAETPIRVIEVVPSAADTALQAVGQPTWKSKPPNVLTAPIAQSSAAAIVRGIRRGRQRIVYPSYSPVSLQFPATGRYVARSGGHEIHRSSAVELRQFSEKRIST